MSVVFKDCPACHVEKVGAASGRAYVVGLVDCAVMGATISSLCENHALDYAAYVEDIKRKFDEGRPAG